MPSVFAVFARVVMHLGGLLARVMGPDTHTPVRRTSQHSVADVVMDLFDAMDAASTPASGAPADSTDGIDAAISELFPTISIDVGDALHPSNETPRHGPASPGTTTFTLPGVDWAPLSVAQQQRQQLQLHAARARSRHAPLPALTLMPPVMGVVPMAPLSPRLTTFPSSRTPQAPTASAAQHAPG